jgi:acetolactate synthase-1/2/3 large subunit
MSANDVQREPQYGGGYIAKAFLDAGADVMFGIPGITDNLVGDFMHGGGRAFTVRHEQTAAFAADGYARTVRKPGVVFTSLANGAMNTVPGMFHARGANSPVVLLASAPPMSGDGLPSGQGNFSPALITRVMEHATKFAIRIPDVRVASFWVREAIHRAMEGTPGPVALELPMNVNGWKGSELQRHYVTEHDRLPRLPLAAGDASAVRDLVVRLIEAKRPVIINGDRVFWADAASELIELAELLQIPTCGRRMGRGALSESHRLSFTPALRRGFLEDADLVVLLGHQVTSLDGYFDKPAWNHSRTWAQVQERAEDVWYGVPTDLAVIGSVKLVLRQMLDCAREALRERSVDHKPWTDALEVAAQRRRASVRREVDRDRGKPKIHPNVLCQEIAEYLDDSSTLILDSFVGSTHMTDKFEAKYAGHVLDAGLYMSLGHSIGMAIGAQVARPGRQVLSLIGDGGFGISGMDMETMVRYGLPSVVVLLNNASWGGRAWAHDLYYPKRKGTGDLSEIRYDKMFEHVGCHVEHVDDEKQIKSALERAFASGKPALIDVASDTDRLTSVRVGANLMDVWVRDGVNELPPEALAEIRSMPRAAFEGIAQSEPGSGAGGLKPTLDEIIDYFKPDFATRK